jgi:hypothetical protein
MQYPHAKRKLRIFWTAVTGALLAIVAGVAKPAALASTPRATAEPGEAALVQRLDTCLPAGQVKPCCLVRTEEDM